jgi:hypothetical protein
MQRTRIPRSANRATYRIGQISAAPDDGQAALREAWSWILKEVSNLEEKHPRAAAAARWALTRSLCLFAARLPRARIAFRRGLTEDETRQLLHPWDEEGDRR